jgi:hypothetical protein
MVGSHSEARAETALSKPPIKDSRVEIDQHEYSSSIPEWLMDTVGSTAACASISAIKMVVPTVGGTSHRLRDPSDQPN